MCDPKSYETQQDSSHTGLENELLKRFQLASAEGKENLFKYMLANMKRKDLEFIAGLVI